MPEKEIMAESSLDMDALTLYDFLDEHIGKNHDLVVVYVQDDEGRTFQYVKLIAETLTDGSVVHNLVLS